MSSVKIPLALDESGHVVSPESARISGAVCVCPGCRQSVHARIPQSRRSHFYHAPEAACNPETAAHALAKAVIAQCFESYLHDKTAKLPTLLETCYTCFEQYDVPLRVEYDSVVIEGKLANGRRPDILLQYRRCPVLAIEICHSHAVDLVKAADLLSIPWIELDAATAIERPMIWRPTQSHISDSSLDFCRCARCDDRCRTARVLMSQISKITRQPIIEESTYIKTAPFVCPACHRLNLVYGWRRGDFISDAHAYACADSREFELEIPDSVVTDKELNREVNSCYSCRTVFSDWQMWLADDAPFHGLEMHLDGTHGDDFDDHVLSQIAYNLERTGRHDLRSYCRELVEGYYK